MAPVTTRLRFTPGPVPLVGVLALVTLVATLSVAAHLTLFGPDPAAYPPQLSALLSLPFSAVMVLGTWAVLRYEGVSATEVGLGRSTLLPGVLAFGVFWVTVTAGGVVYLVVTGATGRLGVAFGMPWYWVPVWALLMLTLSNGLTEEFVFRGYVQSKCTALANSRTRAPSAVGVLAAALLFGVPHIPRGLLLTDASLRAVPWILVSNLIPGVAYGLLYYLTQNVWYAGFVHGFANATVVPFDPSAVPAFTPVATLVGVLVGVGYRSWGATTHRVTVNPRKETAPTAE